MKRAYISRAVNLMYIARDYDTNEFICEYSDKVTVEHVLRDLGYIIMK